MTHPTIEAMARAIMRTRVADLGVDEVTIDALLDDDITGSRPEWRKAKAQALAALRALAACEPSEGAVRAGLIAFAEKVASRKGELMPSSFQEQEAFHAGRLTHSTVETMEVWRAMLAELVKECERDA